MATEAKLRQLADKGCPVYYFYSTERYLVRQAVAAESNLRDVAELVHKMHREHEPLVHCAVYLEMTADSKERLRQLQTDVMTELLR